MDIDIDVPNRESVLNLFPEATRAIIKSRRGEILKHPGGLYFTDIPTNPLLFRYDDDHKKYASITYREAEQRGYFKIDVLSVNKPYENIRDNDHIDELMQQEPDWDMLLDEKIVEHLFQLKNYPDLLKDFKARSLDDVAILIALIRPAKMHLIGRPKAEIRKYIWDKPADGKRYYKKSHAYAYAQTVILHMNLMREKLGG